MTKRILPESAYDFVVVDGYDGEETGPFDTMAMAVQRLRVQRLLELPWNRCRISVEWRVNERKVLRLLQPKRPTKKARSRS